MQDKLERLIRAVYRKHKAGRFISAEAHPDEESIACFSEGKLSSADAQQLKRHLLSCERCAEVLAVYAGLEPSGELKVPEDLISKAKNLKAQEIKTPIFEIFLRLKENLLELLNTNADVLLGQELVPAPVLRSRKVTEFKDEITIMKDFEDIRVEVKIEKKNAAAFSLMVLVKEKQTSRLIKDLRVTLLKEDLELESYLTDSGKVIFEHVLLGKYSVEISNLENKLASILLDVKV